MTVPTLITDLSATAGSNPPSGAESVINGDDHLRAHGAFIRQLYDSILALLANLSVSGNTILGDSSSDTLNVGANGIVKDSAGNTGFGAAAVANYRIDAYGTVRSVGGETTSGYGFRVLNSTQTGGGSLTAPAGAAAGVVLGTDAGPFSLVVNAVERLNVDTSGNIVSKVNTSAPTLAVNQQMVYALTSNTNLRISVRGSDGVTRVTNLTLA